MLFWITSKNSERKIPGLSEFNITLGVRNPLQGYLYIAHRSFIYNRKLPSAPKEADLINVGPEASRRSSNEARSL